MNSPPAVFSALPSGSMRTRSSNGVKFSLNAFDVALRVVLLTGAAALVGVVFFGAAAFFAGFVAAFFATLPAGFFSAVFFADLVSGFLA